MNANLSSCVLLYFDLEKMQQQRGSAGLSPLPPSNIYDDQTSACISKGFYFLHISCCLRNGFELTLKHLTERPITTVSTSLPGDMDVNTKP